MGFQFVTAFKLGILNTKIKILSIIRGERMKFEKHEVEWTPEKIDRFWKATSENSSLRNLCFGIMAGRHVADLINQSIKFKSLKNILDLSCGKGDILSFCMKYLKQGQKCYGTDFSMAHVNFVNKRFKDNPVFKKAHLLQQYPSSFLDGFFDLIILTEVIEHLDDNDLDSLLNEAKRLLSPGGYIFITTPYNEDLDNGKAVCPDCGCIFHRWQHVRTWTSESLKNTLAQYAFHPQKIKSIWWENSFFKRVLLNIAIKINFIPPRGIVFIGKRKA